MVLSDEPLGKVESIDNLAIRVCDAVDITAPRLTSGVVYVDVDGLARLPIRAGERHQIARRVIRLIARDRRGCGREGGGLSRRGFGRLGLGSRGLRRLRGSRLVGRRGLVESSMSPSTSRGPQAARRLRRRRPSHEPAAKNVTRTNEISKHAVGDADAELLDLNPSPQTPWLLAAEAASPRRTTHLRRFRHEVNGARVLTYPPEGLGVRCYNPPPADGESALFL